MDNKPRTILVAWDFTEKAEFAFAHAVSISKITGNDITLVHIVKSDKEKTTMEERLQAEAQRMADKFAIMPKYLVLIGSIFDILSKYASEGGTEMVVMGTHGVKGFQRFTGSWALKVIRGSRVPFLVVQDMPKYDKFDKIVFPVDFKRENKEKINWAYYLCKLHNAKIHLVHPMVADKAFRKRIYSNIVFAKKFLDNAGIDCTVEATGKKADFSKEAIEYAEKIDASVILIMTSKTISFVDYIMKPAEQSFIANEAKIPVMVLNPKPKAFSGGFSATGG